MAVSLAVVSADCVLLLNAGTPGAYSATVIDPRWATQEVVDAVLTADAMVCAAVFRSKNNSRTSQFYSTQAGLAHGGLLTNPAGPIAAVKFVVTGGTAPGSRPGIRWEASEIQYEIARSNRNYDPHYDTDGETIWHNGAAVAAASGGGTVSVDVLFPSFTQTSACQAPDEFRWIDTTGAMSILVSPEGENAGPASNWAQQFEDGLKAIMAGETPQRQEAAA